MAGNNVVEFTDANFQTEVLDSDQPVLVDFWAPWCGPCRMLAPTIDQLGEEFAGRVRVGKLNTDDNPSVATNYQISAIPTVLLFKNGQPVKKFVGVTPKDQFATAISGQLG